MNGKPAIGTNGLWGAPGLARATNSNRTNSQGDSPLSTVSRTSQQILNVLPAASAGVPGTLVLPVTGMTYYFITLSAPITVRPSSGKYVGIPVEHQQGTGQNFIEANTFTELQLQNDNEFPVLFEMFVGFDGFIDNRLTVANPRFNNFSYSTYATASSAATVEIPDLSGTLITDADGREFYALNRAAIIVGNLDASQVLSLRGGTAGTGDIVCPVYPTTSLNYPARRFLRNGRRNRQRHRVRDLHRRAQDWIAMLKLIDSRTVAPEDIRFDPTTYHFTRKSTGEDITDQIRRADKVRLVSDFDIERENFRLSSERGSGQGQYGLTELDDSILSNLGSQIVNDGVFAAPLETLDNTVSQFWKSSGIRTLIAIAAVGLTAYIYLKFFRQ